MTATKNPRRRFRRDEDGYAAWVALTDGPLLVLAVAFIVVLALPYAFDLNHAGSIAVTVANVMI